MAEEHKSQEFTLDNIEEEIRNYFDKNELMMKKDKNIWSTLKHIEHFLILASVVTGCIWISAFDSLLGIPIGITSSAIGLKCAQ